MQFRPCCRLRMALRPPPSPTIPCDEPILCIALRAARWTVSSFRPFIMRLLYFGRTGRFGCRRRTPGPPPFSAMNSTPAFSKAFRNPTIVRSCAANAPGWVSSRFTLGSDTPEALARSRCSHRSSALAARTCSLVMDNLIPQVLTWSQLSFNTSGIA